MVSEILRSCDKLFIKYARNFKKLGIRELLTQTDFTKDKYDVCRGDYSRLEEDHIIFFRHLLGEERVAMDFSDLEKYNIDHFKHLRGNSRLVLKPKTTEEVSSILNFCNNNCLAVVPQGGNTGMVGGSVPVFDEIIVTTELMNQVIKLDELSGVLTCQSGCILQSLDDYLDPHGLMMPIDLGARGSCHIGGNVSTNAGGLRLLRYGNLHGNVLGLEIVKADGGTVDCLNTLKKDNTGYDLKHLFIGSEGTLGFITKVAIQCPAKPKAINVAFLGCQSFDRVMKTFKKAKQELGEILSAFEVMDTGTMELVNEHLEIPSPIGLYPFYILVETSGCNPQHDEEKINTFLETSLVSHFVLNGTVTNEPSKVYNLWSLRHRIPEAFLKDGYVLCYDVSLPYEHYYELVQEMVGYMGDKSHRVFGFGHLGDGNLHLQISLRNFTPEMRDYIEPYLFKRVTQLNGSISAEHGIGFLKRDYMNMVKSLSSINLMKSLKQLLDPNKILNPYKVL